jgi:hypothetical protein
MPQQRFEKLYNLLPLDRAGMNLKIKVPQSESGDDRKTLPTKRLLDHRRLSARRPGSHPMGTRAQPAFVEKYNGAAFFAGFFLTPAMWNSSSGRSFPRRVQWLDVWGAGN